MTTHTPTFPVNPGQAAAQLIREHQRDPEWLDKFSDALDRRRQAKALARIMEVWGLSRSELGRRFGVSRQAVAKWLRDGIPVERAEAIADLSAATDILTHYLRRDRIAAVVRRSVAEQDGYSLVEMLGAGRHREILTTCRDMFDFAHVQG